MLPRVLGTSVAGARRLSTVAAAAATTDKEFRAIESTSSTLDMRREASPKTEARPRERTNAAGEEITKSGGGDGTPGRRIFSLVYAKHSPVAEIRKWKEEGRIVRKYEVNRIVRELRRLKRYRHALEICEWMRTQEDMRLVSGDYAVHLDLVAKTRGLNSAEKFFEDLPENMIDPATCSALLHTYVQQKEAGKAEALMAKISECGFVTSPLPYNHMLTLYLSTGELEKVSDIINELKRTTSPDTVTYNLWLAACASQNSVEAAEKVFLEQSKAKIEPDWVTYSTLASIYIKNSMRDKAESALKDMEKKVCEKSRAGYSSLISLHAGIENQNEILRLWKVMKSTYRRLNDSEYLCAISSLLKVKDLKEAEKLYDDWESISPTNDSRIPNLLIAAYINSDQMKKAVAFFDRMVKREIVPGYTTWELLTWGYLKEKNLDKILHSFKKAVTRVRKWDPDENLVREVFRIVEEFGHVEGAERLFSTLRRAGYVNADIYKFLLRTYAKTGKTVRILERMKKDNVEVDEEMKRLVLITSEKDETLHEDQKVHLRKNGACSGEDEEG